MAEKKQKPKQKATAGKKVTRNQTIFPRAGFRVDGNRLGKGGKICK